MSVMSHERVEVAAGMVVVREIPFGYEVDLVRLRRVEGQNLGVLD